MKLLRVQTRLLTRNRIQTVIFSNETSKSKNIFNFIFNLASQKIVLSDDIEFYSDSFQKYPINQISKAYIIIV